MTPILDGFFRRCSEIVADHDGIVDKFMGDSVMAFFNVPLHRPDHVAQAVSAATQIQLSTPRLPHMDTENSLKVGIGIGAGIAMTGIIGSDDCKDYTVVGDAVNLAARLQAQARAGEILVSEEVYEQVGGAFPNARKRTLRLKGIDQPVAALSLT